MPGKIKRHTWVLLYGLGSFHVFILAATGGKVVRYGPQVPARFWGTVREWLVVVNGMLHPRCFS